MPSAFEVRTAGAAYAEGSDVTAAACPGRSCIVPRLRRDSANELADLAGRLRRIAPPFSQAGAVVIELPTTPIWAIALCHELIFFLLVFAPAFAGRRTNSGSS